MFKNPAIAGFFLSVRIFVYLLKYKYTAIFKIAGPASGSNRVKRGGSWNNNANNCSVSIRNNNNPANRNNNLGFRFCRSASAQLYIAVDAALRVYQNCRGNALQTRICFLAGAHFCLSQGERKAFPLFFYIRFRICNYSVNTFCTFFLADFIVAHKVVNFFYFLFLKPHFFC